jgi:hypothetical protein
MQLVFQPGSFGCYVTIIKYTLNSYQGIILMSWFLCCFPKYGS